MFYVFVSSSQLLLSCHRVVYVIVVGRQSCNKGRMTFGDVLKPNDLRSVTCTLIN